VTLKERAEAHWRSPQMYSPVHFNIFKPLKSQQDRRGRPSGVQEDYRVFKGRTGRFSTYQKPRMW